MCNDTGRKVVTKCLVGAVLAWATFATGASAAVVSTLGIVARKNTAGLFKTDLFVRQTGTVFGTELAVFKFIRITVSVAAIEQLYASTTFVYALTGA